MHEYIITNECIFFNSQLCKYVNQILHRSKQSDVSFWSWDVDFVREMAPHVFIRQQPIGMAYDIFGLAIYEQTVRLQQDVSKEVPYFLILPVSLVVTHSYL
jgi:hypothetical protein